MRISGIAWEPRALRDSAEHIHIIKITIHSDAQEGVAGVANKADAIEALARVARDAIDDQLIRWHLRTGVGV